MDDDDQLYLSCEDDQDYGYDDEFDGDSDDYIQEHQKEKIPDCKVITKESLMAAQKDDLARVMGLLLVKEHHARTLLIHFRWDTYKIDETLSERGKEWLFAAAGVPTPIDNNVPSSLSMGEVTCEICFDDVPVAQTTRMDCGHCFCNNCWKEHFIVMINEGKSRRITCMAHKCIAICDEWSIRSLVGAQDRNLADKFDQNLLESYIDDNNLVKWCPSVPHCGNAIRVGSLETDEVEVECSCGFQFCFNCSCEAHSPCSCLMWKLWIKKCEDESETVNWMTANAKYCPKCHKPVQKNGGCNLVTCICGQHFCWLCGGATGFAHTYTSIDGHSCGRFVEDEKKKAEKARMQLFRYTHYYNRFKGHSESLKKETEMKSTVLEKVAKLETKSRETGKDFSWVENGMCRLFRSRRILLYSYPFAYFMFGDELSNKMSQEEKQMKQNLFEDHQQQLEANVERISKHLEEDFSEFSFEDLSNTRMQIIALSGLIDKFCKGLFEYIENDLLDLLQQETHTIASYLSTGAVKAHP